MVNPKIVYVIGAGLSASLQFPTVNDLLPKIWERIQDKKMDGDIAKVIRFHHPNFNPALRNTYPNIETLLSEIDTNEQLFAASRPAIGNFAAEDLIDRREDLLLEIARWFHELQSNALKKPPSWLTQLVSRIKTENAEIISFNWDLVLDQLLFGDSLDASSYGFLSRKAAPVLYKPHGSLNWYRGQTGRLLKQDKKFKLYGGKEQIFAFKPFREPISKRARKYMPLIIPPVYNKQFKDALFNKLWKQVVSAISTASEVRFIGYSLPAADFHARFIMRCGFYNQEHGELTKDGTRKLATGRARVVVVDPSEDSKNRVEAAVGWPCKWHPMKIENWVDSKWTSFNSSISS